MKRGKAEKLSYDVQPTVAHPDEVEGIVQASGIQDYNSMQDTTYEVTDTGLIVHKGIAGTRPDVDALKQQIQTNVTAMNFQDVISCPTAENQLTEPDFAGIASQIYTEPVNATLDPDNGYSVVASKNGTSMDADSAKAEYESAEENTDITIPFTFTEPEITTEKMNANLFKDTLGSYSSSAAGGTSGRIHNVGLTASICNGQIVLPGETFSFNGVVGDTTAEKDTRRQQAIRMAKSSRYLEEANARCPPHCFPLFCIQTLMCWKEPTIRCRYIMCRQEWMQPYSGIHRISNLKIIISIR